MLKTRFLLFYLFAAVLPFLSCRKHYICRGNCYELNLAGQVINKAGNTPLPGQIITAKLNQNGLCLFCGSSVIGSAKTDDDGRFILTTSFDTSLFGQKHITVSVKVPEGFLSYPMPTGPGIVNDPNSSPAGSAQFYEVDRATMANISFGFYPKALLTLKMHRTTAITPHYPDVSIDFSFADRTSSWGIMQKNTNADTSLVIYTSRDVFTKVITRKFVNDTTVVSTLDSIKCTAGGNNVIDINY